MAQQFEKVLYEKQGRIAYITINRPERMNAIDSQTSKELHEAFTDFRDDDDVWVSILTGAGGRAFSAGNDLVAMAQMMSGGGNAMAGDAPFGGITRNFECWKPMIAAINGYCLAGGLEIALSCDIRVASDKSVFGLPEVTRAILPGAGGTQRLPRAIPFGLALEMVLTGGRFGAEWASRYGLVNHVVPPDQVMPKAVQIAEAICENGPLAVRLAKEAVYASASTTLEDGLRFEAQQSRRVIVSEDAREGPRAFAEKRKPEYKGR
ncbi:MAG TPA: enoyl-CoA hydratase-related protein [Dehalococcoidia bacterium]|nr:enoyl-CoA hydratase-related protein [Dehalococcoidia bacterium]